VIFFKDFSACPWTTIPCEGGREGERGRIRHRGKGRRVSLRRNDEGGRHLLKLGFALYAVSNVPSWEG